MNEPPLSSERAARRHSILQAAIETFAEHGFAASRTRDIAARAGVAEGTIYLYFQSKDDLLLTAFADKVEEFCRSVETLVDSDLPFFDTLTRFVAAQFEGIEQNPELATVLLMESRLSTKFYGVEVRDVLRRYAAAVDRLLQRGVSRGELRPDVEIPLARRVLVGALEEIELDWLLGERTRPLSPVAPRVATLVYRGLASDPQRV